MKADWPTFDKSMTLSLEYNNSRTQQDKWDLLINRYNLLRDVPPRQAKIPKIIHQVWIGGNIPRREQEMCRQVKNFAQENNWEYFLWTENDINQLSEFKNIQEFNSTPNNGQKSDIIRSQILYERGGVYLDTDFVLLKMFDNLLDLDYFCGVAYDGFPSLFNGLIGTTPGNVIIADMLNLDMNIGYKDGMDIINTTGPYLVTRKVFKHIESFNNLLVLPVSFFYPFPNTDINKRPDYRTYLQPETNACHVWSGSWM